MKKVFFEVDSLDKRCYEEFGLSEDVLQEHASMSMANFIKTNFKSGQKILIVCGGGNNGADGMAISRLLDEEFCVALFVVSDIKTDMAKVQFNRAKKCNIKFVENVENCDILVDCLFGSGLNRALSEKYLNIIDEMNKIEAFKLSCDSPSGLFRDGNVDKICFKADATITMGAFKLSLFSDIAKEFVGNIYVANLGISSKMYEISSNFYLLEYSDLKLPFRVNKNSHKGNFGHLNIISGKKVGASIIASLASINFGAGLTTIVSKNEISIPHIIMQSQEVSKNATAIAVGMGLDDSFNEDEIFEICKDKKCVIDADMFYKNVLIDILQVNKNVVLTPHPKEFASLLKMANIGEFSVDFIQQNRFNLALEFCKKFSDVVLLLKGANMLICQNDLIFINHFGTSALSKGGSGDILSGLIGAVLAQNYSSLDATISGSLALTKASNMIDKNSFSHTPDDLISCISKI